MVFLFSYCRCWESILQWKHRFNVNVASRPRVIWRWLARVWSRDFALERDSNGAAVKWRWKYSYELKSSQSPHTSVKEMLFPRWHHHLRFCSGFPYAPLKAMVTKISKCSRIQDSFRITTKIETLVACAMPDIPSKFQIDPSVTFWVILLTHRQTDRQTVWQKQYLLGGGNKLWMQSDNVA